MKVSIYSIVSHPDASSLVLLINDGIEKGWQPIGGLCHEPIRGFVQAIAKYEEAPKKKPHTIPLRRGKDKASCLDEVKAYCLEQGLTMDDGTYLWEKWSGNDWTVGNQPIRDWRATVRSWKAAGYLPSQRHNPSHIAKTASGLEREARIRRLKDDLRFAEPVIEGPAIKAELKKLGAL